MSSMRSTGAGEADEVTIVMLEFMLTSASETPVSLADVFPSCLAALGVDAHPNRLGLAPAHSAVVILVDGLGELNLKSHRAHARYLSSARTGGALQTVFPSTTSSALASLTTGTWPGQHGLVGYKVRDPKSGSLINQLRDLGSVHDAGTWALSTPLYSRARDAGIATTVVSHPRLRATPLTSVIHAGAAVVSAPTIEERLERASKLVAQQESQLVLVYISELDEAAHKFGVNSTEWTVWLEQLDHAVSHFTSRLPANVGVVLTADHGVVDVPAHKQLLFGTSDEQMQGISQVGGEPRCLQLYIEEGAVASEVAARWNAEFGEVADVLTRDQVIAHRLMGDVHPDAVDRMGDVFVIARKLVVFYDARDEAQTGRAMIGQHGSLSEDELRIPNLRWGAFA